MFFFIISLIKSPRKVYTAKNYIQELQVFWSMLRRFVSQHIAGYRKVGASYTYIQGFMSYDSVTTIMDAATTILYLPTFFLGWGTKKLYLHHIKKIRLCNHKMCSSTTFMQPATCWKTNPHTLLQNLVAGYIMIEVSLKSLCLIMLQITSFKKL